MDVCDFEMELSLSGQVEFYHPSEPGLFHVVEQRIDTTTHRFRDEYILFTIRSTSREALSEPVDYDFATIWSIVQVLLGQGWRNIDPEDADSAPKIPKRDPLRKWQICPRIRGR